jgi:multicomponent Na+:H+ antiporter subunit B
MLGILQYLNLTSNSLGMKLLEINKNSTQTANAVTSVVTYFRGLDTLGEVTILFLAIFGISLGVDKNSSKINIFQDDNFLLKIGVKTLFPLIILFGFYIILHGHLTAGGGFQGGVVIASGFLLMFLANENKYSLNHKLLTIFESFSGVGFVLFGVLGVVLANHFLGNFLPLGEISTLLSGGIIPIIYIFVGIKVASEITILIEHFIEVKND